MRPHGLDTPLYILPFDHRGSFQKKMFGWEGQLTAQRTAETAAAKRVIYDALKASVDAGVPKQKAGILVDEEFGAAILRDAAADGYVTACPAEKSGQDEFDFEYGEEFAKHIEAFDPTFCKVLVRYNPEGNQNLNRRQSGRLKRLSEYLSSKGRSRFMFELLVPPEKAQLEPATGTGKGNARRRTQQAGVWRCGNRYALSTSPHPRRRLRTNSAIGVTLKIHLVQKTGHLGVYRAIAGRDRRSQSAARPGTAENLFAVLGEALCGCARES